jgi:hypothetical protein
LQDIVTVGASYRQIHTEGSGTSIGYIFNDYGIYADITALKGIGVEIGVGYSGQIAFEDGDEADAAPVKSGIHLDVVYSGIPNLSIGLFNNVSFYTLAADKSAAYDEAVAAIADIYADEASFVLYNELKVSYAVTEKFVPSVKALNYYGTLTGVNGVKGSDYGKDVLTAEAQAAYKITENTEFRSGIRFEKTIYDTPAISDILKNSGFVISLPVGLTIKW